MTLGIRSLISTPAWRMHFSRFLMAGERPVKMWASTSSLIPLMPTGYLMPRCSSTVKLFGMMRKMLRFDGIETACAASSTRSISCSRISLFGWEMAITPLLFDDSICVPPIPTKTWWIGSPAIRSASSNEAEIQLIASSTSITMPRRRPWAGEIPTPIISGRPVFSSMVPTTVRILALPRSILAIMRCRAMKDWLL